MDDAPLDLDLAPENLLELLHSHAMPQDGQRFRNGLDVRTLDEMRGDVLEWVGPRTKVLRADKVRDPQTKRPTIWQLLEPLHKIKSQSLLRRKAETAGVDAAALSSAELAERPKEAILQLHIERLTSSGNSPARSELHELHSTLEAVRLEARTENHYLLICAASAPTLGITIQCLKGFAESIAAFQAEVAQEIARQLESARASQSPEDGGGSSGGGGPGSRLSTPRGVQPVGEEETGLPPVEIPVTTLAQRIVDIDVAIEAAKDAMKKDVLRKRRGVLERRLVELKDDKPARQVQAKREVPWARGLEEPPRQPKDLGPRGGGVVLVYDQEQRIRLGVTEMGDPVPGENRDGRSAARRMFDKHTISMTRIRQLAEPEHVAMALTGTKFNNGGLEAEREEARGWLHQWASIGWGLTAAVELMWQGEREFTKLSSACEDRLTRPLLQLILDAELGWVKRLPPPPAAAAAAAASEGGGGGGGGGAIGGGGSSAAAEYANRIDNIGESALHSPTAFIPTPPSSRSSARGGKGGKGGKSSTARESRAGDRSRRALRSKDLSERIRDDIGRLEGSKGATEALFAAEETVNTACSAAPMLSADDIRRNIRRPELRLVQAVARSDRNAVAKLLAEGAALRSCDPLQPGWTPLHEAAQRGDLEVLKLLISHGASADAFDELTGTTPFLWACYCGHADCVKEMLLDGTPTPGSLQMNWSIPGPNLERHLTKDDVGRTGLQIARLKRHDAVVEILVMHEASLKIEEKRTRWYHVSRQQQETLAEDYGVQGPPPSLSAGAAAAAGS
jgi:hypothetical protein